MTSWDTGMQDLYKALLSLQHKGPAPRKTFHTTRPCCSTAAVGAGALPAECHLNFPLDFLRAVLLHVASICLQSFGENALGHFHSICLEDYLGVMYRVSDNQSSSKPLSGGNTARVAWKKLGCEQVACSFLLHTGMFRLLAVTCMGHLSTEGVLPPFLVKLRPDANRNKGARKSGNKGQ